MRGLLERELFFQATTRLKQTIGPVLGNRTALTLALLLERPEALAHPRPPALRTRHELPRIELDRHLAITVVGRWPGRAAAFALQALLGLAQRLAPSLAGA